MYCLTSNPDLVIERETHTAIPRGHRLWAEYEAWCEAGNVAPLMPKSLDQLISDTKARLSAWLDEVVQAHGYDNIVSCASYATSTNATFKAEAEAAIAWRDAVYATGYALLSNIPDGIESPDQVMELMPQPTEFGWPE